MWFADRVKTPTRLQMDAAECGATALSIIMGYYGRHLLSEEARQAVGVSRDGSKAINIVKAARRYGMKAEGANLEIEEVRALEFPVIAFWEFDHFLVIEGFGKNKVYLNDPATGPRTISLEEFDKSYTGIVMILRPGPKFKKAGKPEGSITQHLWTRLKNSKGAFAFVVLVTFVFLIPSIAIPIFSKVFIDQILIDHQVNWIIPLIVGMSINMVIMAFLAWLQKRYLLRLNTKLKLAGSANFFWHLLHLPMNFFQQRSNGDIAERVSVNDKVANLLSAQLTSNLVGIISMFAYGVTIWILNWQLTLISLAIVICNFCILIFVNRKLTDLSRRLSQDSGKLNGIEMHGMQIMDTIKANALEDKFFMRWSAYHAKTINTSQRIQIIATLLNILPNMLNGLGAIIVLSLGSYYIIQGYLTIGTLIAFQSLLGGFAGPLNALIGLGTQIQELRGDVVRLNDVITHPPDQYVGSKATSEQLTPKPQSPIVEIKSLQFGYSKLEPPIFYNLALTMRPRERIAIVGPSGGGKSSLAKLLCGLYKPWKGDILLAGYHLPNISKNALANFLALVDQQIFLFEGTIRDNLTLWDDTIPEDRLIKALEDACILDLIQDRGGLDCEVREGGGNFSGGQAQRLEIARALVKNPQLLILDEATSAIDPIVEQRIYENLKKRDCSLFIIAHRLSTIRDCDQIIVIEEGEMTQHGTHEELVEQPGLYQSLITLEQT